MSTKIEVDGQESRSAVWDTLDACIRTRAQAMVPEVREAAAAEYLRREKS